LAAIVVYIIYTYPLQSFIFLLIIISIIVIYCLDKYRILSKISSAFAKKGNFDLVVYEYLIWSFLPVVLMYILGLNVTIYFGLVVVSSVIFFLWLAPILAYVSMISRPLIWIREEKKPKNTSRLLLIEWTLWAIVIPLFIIGFFIILENYFGYSIEEIWITYKDLFYRYIVAIIYFMWLIIGPICAYISVLTRPFFKKSIFRINLEKERKEIIDMINKTTDRTHDSVKKSIRTSYRFCNECNAELEDNHKFCPICGFKYE